MQIYKMLKKQTVTRCRCLSKTGASSVTGETLGEYVQNRTDEDVQVITAV